MIVGRKKPNNGCHRQKKWNWRTEFSLLMIHLLSLLWLLTGAMHNVKLPCSTHCGWTGCFRFWKQKLLNAFRYTRWLFWRSRFRPRVQYNLTVYRARQTESFIGGRTEVGNTVGEDHYLAVHRYIISQLRIEGTYRNETVWVNCLINMNHPTICLRAVNFKYLCLAE